MPVKEVLRTVEAERAERLAVDHYRAASVRLSEDLWQRLDALASEVGWSRNRLIMALLDEASFDLALELCRSGKKVDRERLAEFLGSDEASARGGAAAQGRGAPAAAPAGSLD